MSFYRDKVFPLLCEWTLDSEHIAKLRRDTLSSARGQVLEIGLGTGLNLPCYPAAIREITAVEPNPSMSHKAQQRAQASNRKVDLVGLNGESIPLADHSMDTVVSTFTFCSIADLNRALSEIHRVLRPGGRLLFLEHGLSAEPRLQKWQHRLNPIQKVLGDGCHLNRDMESYIENHAFQIHELKRFYLEHAPRFIGAMYQGVACKPEPVQTT